MDRRSVIHTLSERGGYDEISSNILKQNSFTINDNVKKRKTSLQIDNIPSFNSSSDPVINNKDEELLDEIYNSDLEELSNNNPDSCNKLQNNTITEDICQSIHDDSTTTKAFNTVSFKNTPVAIKKKGGKLKKRKRKSHLISTIDSNNNTILNSNEKINSNSITPAVTKLSNVHTTIDNVSDMTVVSKSCEDIIDYKSDLFTMMQNHSTNIYQLLNKSKEKPIFELEILKNDQIVNKNSSQSLYDYFTEIGFEFDISPTLENHSLSKRGRHFYDLFEEEEFLLKLSSQNIASSTSSSQQQLVPSVLDDWHELFPDWYSDNHDGYYREWLRNQQEEMKHKLIEENKYTKKKRISTDPIFRTQSKSLDLKGEDLSILSNIVAPPVPVAIHHPACWGINTRIHCYSDALKRNGMTDDIHDQHLDKQQCDNNNHSIVTKDSKEQKPIFEMIHPACYSNKIITHPIHKKNTVVNSNTQLNNIPCKYKANNNDNSSTTVVVPPYQDVDDFNIFVDKINQDLELIEADNYLKLLRLQHVIKISENSTKLTAKRQKLEDLLYRAICKNEPTNADRLIYNSSKCKVKQGHYNKKQNTEVTAIVDNYNITNKNSLETSNEMKASLLSR